MLLNIENSCSVNIYVKQFIIGGEILLNSIVKQFYNQFKKNKFIITNVYGPTECCVDTTYYNIDLFQIISKERIPIGTPSIKYSSVYIRQ